LAYEQYTAIWKKNPKNAFANLLRGVATEEYWWQASFPKNNIRLTAQQDSELFQVAKKCLGEAVKLKPKHARAKTAYGMFLWKHVGSEHGSRGLAIVQEAAKLEPTNARVQAALGEIYTTPMRKTYNPKKAETHLLKATQLDSTYSYPHYVLIRLYMDMKQFQKAQKSLEAYKSLVPKEFGERTAKFFDPIIAKGLTAAKP
jgi:cytochrome c-type biogenesis protein CcmH/NrfG